MTIKKARFFGRAFFVEMAGAEDIRSERLASDI